MSTERDVFDTYDSVMYADYIKDLWGHSDFHNFGYWAPDTVDQVQACKNLVDRLLAFVPKGSRLILDVACGMGATTGYIASRFGDATVNGVNFSIKQLTTARTNHPNCLFARMDAAQLAYPDESFDAIVCVEAAFHFDTRERFLREALRVLKPGGVLVLSDVLVVPWLSSVRKTVTARNMAMSLDSYRKLYGSCGFGHLEVIDSTTESVTRLCQYHRRWARKWLRDGRGIGPVARVMLFDLMLTVGIRHYLLVGARKPPAQAAVAS